MRLFQISLLSLMLLSPGFAQETGEKIFTATIDSDGVQRISISAGEYFFKPNRIIVKVNVPVEMSIKKTAGFVPHNIVIDAPDTNITIDESLGKEPKIIKFTPGKAGKYPFYCTKRFLFFKSHREKGMEGILEVVE